MMKRSSVLAPLSRDHHLALVVARALSLATLDDVDAVARQFVEFLVGHELAHFAVEESVLLPALHDGPLARTMVARVLDDHEHLRTALRTLQSPESQTVTVAWLHELGARLRAHVQFEERELFSHLERSLTEKQLDDLGRRLASQIVKGAAV